MEFSGWARPAAWMADQQGHYRSHPPGPPSGALIGPRSRSIFLARVDHSMTAEDLTALFRDIECLALARAVHWHTQNRVGAASCCRVPVAISAALGRRYLVAAYRSRMASQSGTICSISGGHQPRLNAQFQQSFHTSTETMCKMP